MGKVPIYPWSLTLPWRKRLLIDAQSYIAYIYELFPWAAKLPVVSRPFSVNHPGIVSVSSKWAFYMHYFPAAIVQDGVVQKTALALLRDNKRYGVCGFTSDVCIPTLADKTDDFRTWMSITPNEIMTQRPGLAFARGKVCIGGLGLGWLASECLRKKSVRHVTIVEQDPEIAAFFESKLQRQGKDCEVIVDDVYNYLEKHCNDFTSILLDIWPFYNTANEDYRLSKLRKNYQGKLWAWGLRTY